MNDQKAKSDTGKPKLSLVPRRIIFDIARIREYGNSKYPDGGIDNWKQVEPERYKDAAFRHFLAYLDDPYGLDAESGLPHLWHLACNVAFLCDLEDPKSVTFKLTKEGQETLDKLSYKISKNNFDIDVVEEEPSKTIPDDTVQKIKDSLDDIKKRYKEFVVGHTEAEPHWSYWLQAWREHEGEAEYYRTNMITGETQFGDFDFETGTIIPRKEQK